MDFEWSYEACESLGGDMFNIFRLDERRVGMYVLDVSGHGPSAALQSVTLSHVLTPFDQQGGILKRISESSGRYEVTSPAEVARRLNRELDGRHRLVVEQGYRQVGPDNLFLYRFRHSLFQRHLYNGCAESER